MISSKTTRAQSSLQTKLRTNVRQGRLMSATVIDVFFDKASVRLGTNGTIMRGLRIIGGPCKAGDTVNIDFTTPEPTVVCIGASGLSQGDLDLALKSLQQQTSLGETQILITHFSGGAVVDMYPPTSDGLVSALSATLDGDIVWLPDIQISTDLVVPTGVSVVGVSTRQSVILGTITLGERSALENLKVAATYRSEVEVKAIIATATKEPSIINNCEIHCYQCAEARANTILLNDDALLTIDKSLLVADSGNAVSYIVKAGTGGSCTITHCRLFSQTALYDEGTATIEEYSNVEASWSEIEFWCAIKNSDYFASSFASGNVENHHEDIYSIRAGKAWKSPTTTNFQTVTGGFAGDICRKGDYIYTYKYTGDTHAVIQETKISDGSTIEKQVYTASGTTTNVHFCVVGDRRLYVARPEDIASGHQNRIYIVDFNEDTSDVYYSWDRYNPSSPTTDYDYYAGPVGIVSVLTADNDLIVIVYGHFEHYDDSSGTTSIGMYFLYKNYTQDSTWTMKHEEMHATITNASQNFNMAPRVVDNHYIIWVPSISTAGSSVEAVTTLVCMYVMDITDGSVDHKTIEYGSNDSGDSIEFYDGCTDNYDSISYASANMAATDQGNIFRVFKFNPAAMTITTYDDISPTSSYFVSFLSSRTVGYMIVRTISGNTMDLIRLHDSTTLWNDVAVPNSGGFFPGVINVCSGVDEVGRIWYFDIADDKMKGVLVSNFSNKISFASGVAHPTVSPQRIIPVQLGDVWVLFKNKHATNDLRFYYIKE